jgi:hypothetical protein
MIKGVCTIWLLLTSIYITAAQKEPKLIAFDFYGAPVQYSVNKSMFQQFNDNDRSGANAGRFISLMENADFTEVFKALATYRLTQQPDDWMYYQLVRRIAETLSPKTKNYWQYTLYKFFLMYRSGYDPILAINPSKIVFFIQSDDNIYNMLFRVRNNKAYICINYHDYDGQFDFEREEFEELSLQQDPDIPLKAFSYRISKLPHFSKNDYVVKKLNFSMPHNEYFFRIKVNPNVKTIFKNYPVVDYDMRLNVPVSEETKESLLPLLKNKVKALSTTDGIDYLLHFVRYAFVYEPDTKAYGTDRRFTPEQTLLAENSDCEDRVSLFYFLVKELYNLPMIVVAYPEHVTVAVKFDTPIGTTIAYNGEQYTFCEPTPQEEELKVGEIPLKYAQQQSSIVYVYIPQHL